MWYFAYGSNMNLERLISRIGYAPERARGILKGYRLLFNKVVTDRPGEGYANIMFYGTSVVEGIVYRIEAGGLAKLDKCEGVPAHYYREQLSIEIDSDGLVDAEVYIARDEMIRDGLLPSAKYLGCLLAGKEFLSEEYYSKLLNMKTID